MDCLGLHSAKCPTALLVRQSNTITNAMNVFLPKGISVASWPTLSWEIGQGNSNLAQRPTRPTTAPLHFSDDSLKTRRPRSIMNFRAAFLLGYM